MIELTDTNSEDVVFLTGSRSVLDSRAGHGEHNLRSKLYSILEHKRMILLWIQLHCGIKGNEHADRLARGYKNYTHYFSGPRGYKNYTHYFSGPRGYKTR